jgi:hypothetical protein
MAVPILALVSAASGPAFLFVPFLPAPAAGGSDSAGATLILANSFLQTGHRFVTLDHDRMQSKQKVCVHEMEALFFIGSRHIVQSSTGHAPVMTATGFRSTFTDDEDDEDDDEDDEDEADMMSSELQGKI